MPKNCDLDNFSKFSSLEFSKQATSETLVAGFISRIHKFVVKNVVKKFKPSVLLFHLLIGKFDRVDRSILRNRLNISALTLLIWEA